MKKREREQERQSEIDERATVRKREAQRSLG